MAPATSLRRLLIVSHVVHYRHAGQLYAYGPYSREIDIWADLFPEVLIAAPCREEPPPGDCLPFTRPNIGMWRMRETGGETLWSKLYQVLVLPDLVLGLIVGMVRADAVHVRCPGNLGLLGAALAPIFRRSGVAKYAGQWNGYRGESWTVRLQRWLLRSWWQGPVTVYGRWPDQPPHIVPFFTSMMTSDQVCRAVAVADAKTLEHPLRVLFAGRLAAEKRVAVLLEAVALVARRGLQVEVTIVGDGPERAPLEEHVRELGIGRLVRFAGALPFDQALAWYEWAHCLVLPSIHSEGWPKVLAEAMCHGVMCIAVDHGQIADMLRGRGVVLQRGDAADIAGAIEAMARDPEGFRTLTRHASLWARQHSLEHLRDALGELLSQHWNVRVAVQSERARRLR